MNDDTTYIATREVWNDTVLLGLKHADRRHHVYVIGKTGSGKSTLLRNLVIQDIASGQGVGLIDPHGDLAEEILDHIPPRRADDLVYFDAADVEHPVGFNILAHVPTDARPLVASSVVGAFKSIWADSWGPRLEYILYNALAALLDCEGTTLLGVPRMLVDERFRARVIRQIEDPMVRAFWVDEYNHYDERFMREAIAPIQNKIGQFLTSPAIRNILGQVRSTIDLRFMMDNRRILIANLAKGKVGEDKANLLGSLLTAMFQFAAISRANVPEDQRVDFYLHVDEFFNFSSSAFASILAEARKYRLCLTLAHQYVDQMTEEVRKAVFGNVGSMVVFRVGNGDALIFEQEFAPTVSAAELVDLGPFRVYAKLLQEGGSSTPLLATTLPPLENFYGKGKILTRRSREKYGKKRTVIQDKIRRWLGG